ncbi:MAG TPA: Mrp/NBP35 family ATP-binding protein [Dehalococcoidia bacterium]|nr:Mrp/NBP35 family ATP-binding protein [Dehalococcoidia bacterium]
MPTREEIMHELDSISVPGVMRSLVKMNLVQNANIADGKVDVSLASAALGLETQEWLKEQIKKTAGKSSGVKEVNVSFVEGKPKDLNEVGHVIAIMSGKGGVGKSLVAGLAAIALRGQGYEVGILDADITGPSIPKMFGISARPAGSDSGILPISSKSGIEVMSINLLLPSEDDAVIWRGPLIGRAITQFWEEVLWGKLDYLIVDLPPGTADAPLTVLQTLPISGIIIVFTPQDLTAMVVRKAVNMARQMGKSIIGVIENMSYLYVPEIDKNIEIFGKSRGEEMSKAASAPLLGQLPIDPQLARLCDEGNIEGYNAEIIASLGKSLVQVTPAAVPAEKK